MDTTDYKAGLAAGADAGYNAARAEIFSALRDTIAKGYTRADSFRADSDGDTPHARYKTGRIRGIEETLAAVEWRLNTLGYGLEGEITPDDDGKCVRCGAPNGYPLDGGDLIVCGECV